MSFMKKFKDTHKKYIVATVFESCVSIIFLICAFLSEYWVDANVYETYLPKSRLNYGLSKGSYYNILYQNHNDVYLTCVTVRQYIDCAYSCKTTKEAREGEVTMLMSGKVPIISCDNQVTEDNSTSVLTVETLNYKIFIVTYVFIGVALLFAAVSLFFALYNVFFEPKKSLLGTVGLIVWNAISAMSSLIVFLTWVIYYNLEMYETFFFVPLMVNTEHRTVSSKLGGSCWFVFVSTVCHVMAVILLIRRMSLLKRTYY